MHPHNAYVIGNHMYLSSYQDGLRVFDVTDPAEPVEVAFFDTFPGTPTSFFQGNWGVDPFQGDDKIYLTDTTNGFFQVSFNGALKATLDGTVRDAVTNAVIADATVFDATAQRSFVSDGGGLFTEKTGEGTHDYEVTAEGYEMLDDTVVLPAGVTTSHTFFLQPLPVATEESPAAIDLRFRAARPNPFASSTTLAFDVPGTMSDEGVTIRVFDARGQLVRTLLDAANAQVAQTVTWDGRNDAGFAMGSGVYYARMTVGREHAEQRLVLTR